MRITAVRPSRSKGYLVLVCSDGEESCRYTLRKTEYTELGSPLAGRELSCAEASSLMLFDEEYRARIFALRSLSLSDSSERALLRKLSAKGIRGTVARDVVAEMVSLGYIKEDEQLIRLVERYANVDLYGPRRIVARLTAKGYSTLNIRAAITALSNEGRIDLSHSRALLLEKKLTRGATEDEKKKLLYKYGY